MVHLHIDCAIHRRIPQRPTLPHFRIIGTWVKTPTTRIVTPSYNHNMRHKCIVTMVTVGVHRNPALGTEFET